MSAWKKAATVLVAAGIAFVPTAVATTGTAHADRCEPEELVTGAGTSPIDERDHPLCYALINYVYPFVCDDFTTAVTCVGSISPNPGYRPALVFYQPDPNRAYCNLYSYAVPNGSCSSATPAGGPTP